MKLVAAKMDFALYWPLIDRTYKFILLLNIAIFKMVSCTWMDLTYAGLVVFHETVESLNFKENSYLKQLTFN